jgi:hypothetical protein
MSMRGSRVGMDNRAVRLDIRLGHRGHRRDKQAKSEESHG